MRVVVSVILICISPVTNDVEHFFIRLFALHLYFYFQNCAISYSFLKSGCLTYLELEFLMYSENKSFVRCVFCSK